MTNYTIKTKNNKVTFNMIAGKDMVENTMDAETAKKMVAESEDVKEHDATHIIVDGKFIFEILPEKKASADKAETKKKKG